MIVDFEDSGTPSGFDADIVIVGAGAAGLALAYEFRHHKARLVILESGGWDDELSTQSLYDTIDTGLSFKSAQTGRFRILGGSTTRWGGQSLPLMPIDFDKREWVPNSGWPLSYDDVGPYYHRANQFLDVDVLDYEDETARLLRTTRPDLRMHGLNYHYSKWARNPNLREVYRAELESSTNTKIVLHANVIEINITDDAVASLGFSTLGGKRGKVTGKIVIMATGALEVARLLLNQPLVSERFEHVLGRYLQDHPATRLGHIESVDNNKLQRLFNGKRRAGRKYSVRVSLSPESQVRDRLLNASCGFLFSLGMVSPLEDARKMIKKELPWSVQRGLRVVAGSATMLPPIGRAIMQYLSKGQIYLPGATCEVAGSFEQLPDYTSRVSLSEQRDALGMRRLEVHWCISEETFRTALAFCERLTDALERSHIGRFVPLGLMQRECDNDFDGSLFHDQNHHLGTARMGASQRTSVVDENLRVHDLANLFIASSAVFPTGGHSNPTLTILALCMRLADHLKGSLGT